MADNKKYYYLKLKENFFEQDHIKVIEALENGYIYSNILLKMYLRSLKFEGKLMITEKIPYDPNKPEILARVLGHDVAHLKECISLSTELEVVKILSSGEIYMMDIQNHIGKSTNEADRIRSYRKRIKENETNVVTNVQQPSDKSTPELELERELKRERERDPEDLRPSLAKNRSKKYIPLAELLLSEHRKSDPTYKAGLSKASLERTLLSWADDIRLIHERGSKRDPQIIAEVIKWCQNPDNFPGEFSWVFNIMSGKKLKEKFDTLYGQYKRSQIKKSKTEHKRNPAIEALRGVTLADLEKAEKEGREDEF